MAILKLSDLQEIRKKYKNKKVIFCSGTFDLVHVGHVLFFEDCKKLGDILIVAIGEDSEVRRYKGKERPIMNSSIRLKMLDSLKPVDYVLLCPAPEYVKEKDDLLFPLFKIFELLEPDVWAINEDAFDIKHRKEISEKYGMKLKILERTCPEEFDDISTSKIIEKIKKLD